MTIKVQLSSKSIDTAIKEVQKYKKRLQKKVQIFKKRIAELGVEYAKVNLINMPKYPGTLNDIINSINSQVKGDKVLIICKNELGIFVELGTGVKGKSSSHDKASEYGWVYMANPDTFTEYKGKIGWWYLSNAEDKNTTKRPLANEPDLLVAFTQGMPARPFMHNAALQIKDEIAKIALEVFSDD